MKSNNFKIKQIFTIFLTFSMLFILSGIVKADSNYYIGEKSNHSRKENYLYGITEEMCNADYWKDKNFIDINYLLMNYDQIDNLNTAIVDGSGTMVFDLTTFKETFNADSRKQSLANSEIPTRGLFIDGVQIDNEAYFTKLKTAIDETGYSGTEEPTKYGICINRTDLKSWPIDDKIGYNATDPDDEMESSAMNLNEPFIIQAKCEVNDNIYYWGYSTNCTGWVNSKNVAICETKSEWLDFFKVDVDANNFVVVTGSRIILKNENQSDINIMLGTILKLVPENEIPEYLATYTSSNYIVYFPGTDEDGKLIKKYGVLNKNLELHQGFLELTQNNILDIAFSCIGDEYGWGGMNGNMDCSLYTRSIYRCFGFELPRNTTWQQKVPNKFTDISKMTDEEKAEFISTLPAGALLYFPGHTMVYIGIDNNKNFVVSDLGSVVDEPEGSVVESVYAVTVNSLDVKRASGTTWLHNLNGVVTLANKLDISECNIEIENTKFIYDGEEKRPNINITYNGKPIYENVNYNIEYINNVEIGEATIKITGINNFSGEIIKTFTIEEEPKVDDDKDKPSENNPNDDNYNNEQNQNDKNIDDNNTNNNEVSQDIEIDNTKAPTRLPNTGAVVNTDPYFLLGIFFTYSLIIVLVAKIKK